MHLNMQYSDIKKLPVRYRKWYIERLVKHFKQMNSKNNKPQETDREFDKLAMFEDQIKKKMT